MRSSRHCLRVAIVYQGTIHREKIFTRTSEPAVRVGTGRDNEFVVPGDALGASFEMFRRRPSGYSLRFTDDLDGEVRIDGTSRRLGELVAPTTRRPGASGPMRGASELYEVDLGRGDWGLVRVGALQIYFQVVGRPSAVAGRGVGSLDRSLVGTIAAAAAAHLAFLTICFLAFDIAPELEERTPFDRFPTVSVEQVDPPNEPERRPEPSEEAGAEKAGGEEGEFGRQDAEIDESSVPDRDGSTRERVDVENLGVNEIVGSENLAGGPLEQIFDEDQGVSSTLDVEMAGDDGELQMGRGHGGMGLRGTEGGGGDEGFGAVGSIGGVEQGDGPGTGAALEQQERTEVEPNVDAGEPTSGEYCDRRNLRRVVESKSDAIQYCYERRLQHKPSLAGKIVVQWKVGRNGSVESTSVASSTVGDPKVESCIMRVVERMRFAQPDGGLCLVEYPFVFSGGD